ncbi:Ig-like domain-containing protein [Trichlorobacter sp.]|uniref:Ig-like domain-containing protein n=1 Tax=Trichlorobacter sp. TaxID=2911007 RepID=UPI002A36517A|nr:Ig-like domain-containing protein [Trichlorobacter sp.]MDY0385115.1 Ig-like domain-containing protein [Trichlorobacter sp.]
MKSITRIFTATLMMLCVASSVWALSIDSVTPGTSTSPGDLNVPVSTSVVIDFDQTVRWNSIYNNGSYRITLHEDATGQVVPVTYSPTSNDDSYTLTPQSSLKYNTIYRVFISRYVKERWDNDTLGSDRNFYFRTEVASDTIRPSVTPIYPGAGATNVPVDTAISALFSEDMDTATVASPAVSMTLSPAAGANTITYADKEANLTTGVNLSPGTTYTVTINNTVADLAGNTMLSNYSWSFSTVPPDSTPPIVQATLPVTGSVGVSITPTIQITFSEAMMASTITATNITVNGGTWNVSFNGDRTATLTLSSGALTYGADYVVTVSTSVRDLAGNYMAAAYPMTFTTVQNITPPNVNEYCQVPPFVAGTGVQPNLLLVVDNSGSMEEFAYKTAGKGNSTGTGADGSYNSATIYYGYFDATKMYKYNASGYFEVDSTATYSTTSFWSGNMLNWLTMRRVDVVRKVLVGGRVLQGSSTSPSNPRSTATTNNYLIGLENTSRDRYKVYSGVYYRIDDGPNLYKCSSSSCSSYTNTYKVKVLIGTQPPTDGLVTQYADELRIGAMFFNTDGTLYEDGNYGDKDGGYIASAMGASAATITYQIETRNPSSWTPLAETLYESVRYFQKTDSAYNGTTYSTDPITHTCQRNFVMVVTDGESTKDRNIPNSNWSGEVTKVTDSYGFNVKTWMDSIGTNEGATSRYATSANGSEGTYYLPGVSYYAHNTDLRSATVGNGAIAGKQNLTIYTVFAFDDSAVGRDLLKQAAKYGGYEDLDADGKPYTDSSCGTTTPNAKCVEWDKNGDGIPDTYFEAQQGQQLVAALGQAFNDILTRVSSGTAASILNNSEGSGASLLQAVFYPKKAFDSGTEVSWVGELQNLWYYLDPYLQLSSIRVDTVADNKLNLLQDNIAQFYFDGNQTLVRLLRDNTGRGTSLTDLGSFSPDDTTNVRSLWRAGRQLWARDLATDNRTIYTRTGDATLDTINGFAPFTTALKTSTTIQSYLQAANATEAEKLVSYIRGTDQSGFRSRAATIAGANGTWRLGDIVSSTPKIQGNVGLNAYHQATPTGYNDTSYEKFTNSNDYKNRGMAYVGANDGMLHAFRMGVLKELTDPCRNLESDSTSSTCFADKAKINDYTVNTNGTSTNTRANAADQIGKEEWAFIPRQIMPYLKYFAAADYPHLFYVDGSPMIVDVAVNKPSSASYVATAYPSCSTSYWECPKQTRYSGDLTAITTDDTKNIDYANTSWRTILIGSTGLGGASRNRTSACATSTGTNCVKTPVADVGYSSYFALDITNPVAPKYLWEFSGDKDESATATNGNLGFATTGPVIVRAGSKDKNGRWFAVFASGPTGPIDAANKQFIGKSDQPLRLFIVDIATGALVKTINTGIQNAFAGSVYNAAIDNDRAYSSKDGFYQDDVIYIGYVQKNGTTDVWNVGGVIRLVTNESINPNDATKPWTWSTVINGVGPVTSAVAKLQDRSNGKQWLYFGTGRYFYKTATGIDDASIGRRLYGIQEPCYSASGQKIDPGCTTAVTTAQLTNQTDSPVAVLPAGSKGWFVNLDNLADGFSAERVITDPVASPSGVVFFTTFRPTDDVCGYGGNSYIWAVGYSSGAAPPTNAMQGKLMVQVSTGAFAEVSMADGFTAKGNRRSTDAIQGVPPKAQGLSLLTNPKPIKKILQVQEK